MTLQQPPTIKSRDTRPCRMQEVFTPCAEIAELFEPNTVVWAFHTIQLVVCLNSDTVHFSIFDRLLKMINVE